MVEVKFEIEVCEVLRGRTLHPLRAQSKVMTLGLRLYD
jgi:hypothetical protein